MVAIGTQSCRILFKIPYIRVFYGQPYTTGRRQERSPDLMMVVSYYHAASSVCCGTMIVVGTCCANNIKSPYSDKKNVEFFHLAGICEFELMRDVRTTPSYPYTIRIPTTITQDDSQRGEVCVLCAKIRRNHWGGFKMNDFANRKQSTTAEEQRKGRRTCGWKKGDSGNRGDSE